MERYLLDPDPRRFQPRGGRFWLYYKESYRSRRTEKLVFAGLLIAKYAAAVRRFRKVVWAVFVAVAAAEIIAVVLPVPFGLALTIALFILAVSVTVVDGIVSGDFAFLIEIARHKSGMATLGAVVLGGSPLSEPALMFTTNTEQRRLVKTDQGPVGVSFITPVEREISSSQVPCKLKRAGLTILRVDRFTDEGIVISNQHPGIGVRAEVSYGSPSQ
jgi:hypothetical protein